MKSRNPNAKLSTYLVSIVAIGGSLLCSNCSLETEQEYLVDIEKACNCYRITGPNKIRDIEENLHQCMGEYEKFIQQAEEQKNISALQSDSLNQLYLGILINELTLTCEFFREDYKAFISDQFFAPFSLADQLLHEAELEGADTTDVHIIKLKFAAGQREYAYNLMRRNYIIKNSNDYYGWWVKGAMEHELGMTDQALLSLDNAISYAQNSGEGNLIKYYQNSISSVNNSRNQLFEVTVSH